MGLWSDETIPNSVNPLNPWLHPSIFDGFSETGTPKSLNDLTVCSAEGFSRKSFVRLVIHKLKAEADRLPPVLDTWEAPVS